MSHPGEIGQEDPLEGAVTVSCSLALYWSTFGLPNDETGMERLLVVKVVRGCIYAVNHIPYSLPFVSKAYSAACILKYS